LQAQAWMNVRQVFRIGGKRHAVNKGKNTDKADLTGDFED